jgi:iron-sulfur cluster repair protein YtfE (RIC family)
MEQLSQALTAQHRSCDELFARAEQAAAAKHWTEALGAYRSFREALERHLAAEEEVLFPAFEGRTGPQHGPTQVMRMEHQEMRGLLADMAESVEGADAERFLALADTLLILMQQHNLKEERVLYPMADRALAGAQADILSRMAGDAAPRGT